MTDKTALPIYEDWVSKRHPGTPTVGVCWFKSHLNHLSVDLFLQKSGNHWVGLCIQCYINQCKSKVKLYSLSPDAKKITSKIKIVCSLSLKDGCPDSHPRCPLLISPGREPRRKAPSSQPRIRGARVSPSPPWSGHHWGCHESTSIQRGIRDAAGTPV